MQEPTLLEEWFLYQQINIQDLADWFFQLFLDYLIHRLRIIKISEPTKDKIRFVLDPIAEYIAGIYVVETFQAEDWNNLTDRLKKLMMKLKKLQVLLMH